MLFSRSLLTLFSRSLLTLFSRSLLTLFSRSLLTGFMQWTYLPHFCIQISSLIKLYLHMTSGVVLTLFVNVTQLIEIKSDIVQFDWPVKYACTFITLFRLFATTSVVSLTVAGTLKAAAPTQQTRLSDRLCPFIVLYCIAMNWSEIWTYIINNVIFKKTER